MGITSLMWSFDCKESLISCGIDAEERIRFKKWAESIPDLPPFIYSDREKEHITAFSDPTTPLCASFCCKEALFKAMGTPYNYNMCELLFNPGKLNYKVYFNNIEGLDKETDSINAFISPEYTEECVLTLYIFRRS